MLAQNAYRLVLALTILLASLMPAVAQPPAGAAPAPLPANIQALHATDQGLSFTLHTPDYTINPAGVVTASGLTATLKEPGWPALPYFTTMIALPPAANAQVTVQVLDEVNAELPVAVRPAPRPGEVSNDDNLNAIAAQIDALVYEPDPAGYATDALYPAHTYTLSDPMYARDVRLVQLNLFPLRYNPATGQMQHSRTLQINVTYHGGQTGTLHPAPSVNDSLLRSLLPGLLNPDQAQSWRSLPQQAPTNDIPLPVGRDAYKIEVNQDGIYELDWVSLAVAGMNVTAVNPNTFQMMYRGQPVAYQWIGDSDNSFEDGEAIRFYGWRFDGSRAEKQFVPEAHNYFWLWAGGTPLRIANTTNPTSHPLAPSFPESITREDERLFTLTRTNQWDQFPNEADAWYWAGMNKPVGGTPLIFPYQVTLLNPATAGGSSATVTAELFPRQSNTWNHNVSVYVDPTYTGTLNWIGRQSVNISTTTPINTLTNGTNTVNLVLNTSDNTGTATYYLNRITVDYQRLFLASSNQLVFGDNSGPHRYEVSGYSVTDPNNVLVWDITDQLQPAAIPMTAGNISGSTYIFGSNRANGRFIATNTVAVRSPLTIARYDVPDIDPAGGGADWIAITNSAFLAQANQLATHRANPAFGSLQTHVVTIDDIIAQYGYGFPLPGAMRSYFNHAVNNWSTPPTYALLIGDANLNPRGLPCLETGFSSDCASWDTNEPTYLLTDLIFKDRYAGLIPSDYTLALLDGDLLPELAVGRLAVQTPTLAANIVEKIIDYEQKHLAPEAWQANILFVADEFDPDAGDFCHENTLSSPYIPDSFNEIHKCLPVDTTPQIMEAFRAELRQIAVVPGGGVTFFNYRGHGSVQDWADATTVPLLSVDFTWWWYPTVGEPNPLIILSMDCLDGNFAFPGTPALSETFHELAGAGTVAHWSSVGLGLTVEHTALQKAFYDGLFAHNMTAIGDATVYAKMIYNQEGWDESELYAFTLQGDPAMQIMRPDLALQKTAAQTLVAPGDPIDYTITVTNDGLYPTAPTVQDTLPAGLSYVNATTSLPANINVNGQSITVTFLDPLESGATATIQLTTNLSSGYSGNSITNVASVSGAGGLDSNPNNNQDGATVFTSTGSLNHVLLPFVKHP